MKRLLKKLWALLGDDRLTLIASGLLIDRAIRSLIYGHWFDLIICVAVLTITVPSSWRGLGVRS